MYPTSGPIAPSRIGTSPQTRTTRARSLPGVAVEPAFLCTRIFESNSGALGNRVFVTVLTEKSEDQAVRTVSAGYLCPGKPEPAVHISSGWSSPPESGARIKSVSSGGLGDLSQGLPSSGWKGAIVDYHRHRFIPLTEAVGWDATVKGSPCPPERPFAG